MAYSKKEQKNYFDQSKHLLKLDSIAKTEAQSLRQVLQYHEWRYAVLNDPVLSDYEYDQLYKKLESYELAHPQDVPENSPTQRVNNDLTEDFPTVKHNIPMLSLNNSYNAEDLLDFDRQVKKHTQLQEDAAVIYAVEPKFDGGSIALVYKKDRLDRAATRGNGAQGDEITNNARAMKSIPLEAAFSKHGIIKAELRGEVLIRKDNFKKINEQREQEGLSILANPRNSASGGLRVKDPKEVVNRKLEAFIYQLAYAVNQNEDNILQGFKTHDETIDLLGDLGFKIPKAERKLCKNINEVIKFAKDWEAKREAYPYEVDGLVIKVNELALQEQCGFTAHHPRWAIAYKFKAKQATTKLLNVEYQVGKVGSITPVAKVEPVELAGVTVSSVSLHNADFIESKDLRLGDTVLVERAGDVIPYIVKAMEDLRAGTEQKIEFPKYCPINLQDKVLLTRPENEAAWRCESCSCGAQSIQKIIFHISKDAMNIDGFGKSYVERFHEMGWLNDISDVYNLDYEAIAALEGFGEKSAAKLRKSIEIAKQNPISRLLHSLSIHHLGKRASKLIAEQIGHVLELKDWEVDQFKAIKDVGPVVAENVSRFLELKSNIEMLERMETLGVNLRQTEEDKPVEIVEDAIYSGKTILFTGSLQTMSRKEAQSKAAKVGAKNISAVSGNLNILVVGEKAGSKLKKAQALGTVRILTEQEFLDEIDI